MNRGYTLICRKVWANPLFCVPGKKFTRLEAWRHLTNVLVTGIDDPDAGLARGEFRASIRRLARLWHWSPSATFRFMRLLEEGGMISRVKHSAEHPAEQEAEHFIICNYSTYNPERKSKRNSEPSR